MKHRIFPLKLFVGCAVITITTACSVGLHTRQASTAKIKSYPNLVEIRTDRLQPMADSLHTIVALTPMTGATVDSLFKGGDKFVIQYPTDLSQPLPAGIDVLYVNTDHNTLDIADSQLFRDTDRKQNVKIMIDGSVRNIKKFCKENANIYNPNAALMVYENLPPEDSLDQDKDQNQDKDLEPGGLRTTAYGKGYNPISYDMLIESIFDFSVNDKYNIEDFKKAFEYTYDPKAPDSVALMVKIKAPTDQYNKAKPASILAPTEPAAAPLLLAGATDATGSWLIPNQTPKLSVSTNTNLVYDNWPYCDWNKWNHEKFNVLWSWDDKVYRTHDDLRNDNSNISPDPEHGTHIKNPGDNFTELPLYRGDYVDQGEYGSGYWNIRPLRRLNCVDAGGYFSMKVIKSWSSHPRLDNANMKSVLTGMWTKFWTKTAKSGYLDFSITSDYTKSFGITRTGGFAISAGGDIGGFSIEQKFESSWSKSESQDIKISKTSQNEYWFGTCMMKVANPIFGRLEAWTKTRFGAGSVRMRFRMLYVDAVYGTTKAVQYEILDGNMPRYSGHMRHANSYWTSASWKRRALRSAGVITNFKDCGRPRRIRY